MIKKALEQLINGNIKYLESTVGFGDVSLERRTFTHINGQKPYAIILSCVDSRVIPEAIFSAGIGDLFVIRSMGNFVGDNELGAMEYAINQFGIELIFILGHTCCGAVNAAIEGDYEGYKSNLVKQIKMAIGEEKDSYQCEKLNLNHSIQIINNHINQQEKLQVIGGIYNTNTGKVDFLR